MDEVKTGNRKGGRRRSEVKARTFLWFICLSIGRLAARLIYDVVFEVEEIWIALHCTQWVRVK